MNNPSIPPPEYELPRSTHNRQREELMAIVAHESHEGTPRRRFVPLLAAAAVLAVTAGLAVGVPALQRDPDVAVRGARQPAVEPLSETDKTRFGQQCAGNWRSKMLHGSYDVVDAFRFPGARSSTYTATWVVLHTEVMGWMSCGIGPDGQVRQATLQGNGQVIFQPVTNEMIGGGLYDRSIARITIKVGTREPVEAVLRHGFYYAPVPYARVRGPRSDSTAIPYVIRGYDAAGSLVYTSPLTDGELIARGKVCRVGPDGKVLTWLGSNPAPDPKTCERSYIWNYLP
jgi:hypothetical protein